jgi:CTP:molybdopterin cytidylyltransferase MocA
MKALVLAGRRVAGQDAYEAQVRISGRPMVEYVVQAVRDHPAVTVVRVVGPVVAAPGVESLPGGQSLWESVERGLAGWDPDERVLVATGDIPLLTTAIVDEFLRRAPEEGDMIYPIVPQEAVRARLPGVQRTYVRLRDGVFTGGNVFLVRPRVVPRVRHRAERLVAHRKAPWRLAQDLGALFLVRFLLGRLALDEVEEAARRYLGITGAALVFPYAEVGIDVDKPSDLERVRAELAKGGAVGA